ncbi:hypothetical protein JCM1840_004441 [Sporobolomyces johnsonii]
MSHSHPHPHPHPGSGSHAGHSRGHGHHDGHGHSHDSSPYDRECQAPSSAASYCFISAFLGGLAAVSLPTHVTGYFLPSIPRTALLWACVVLGVLYAALCVVLFFRVLEVAAVLAIFLVCSIALFTLGLQTQLDEWNEFCTTKSIIVSAESSSNSTSSASSPEDSKLSTCDEMYLNQTYLVLGVPGLLLVVEFLRHFKVASFVSLALDRPVLLPRSPPSTSPSLPRYGSSEEEATEGRGAWSEGVMEQIRNVRELGKRSGSRAGRRRRTRQRRETSDSDEDSDAGLLSV